MSNVAKLNFGSRSRDADWYLENHDRVREAVKRSVDNLGFLPSHPGYSREAVQTWHRNGKRLSLEVLCQHILDDSNQQWQLSPSYYAALILELNERLQVIIKAFGIAMPFGDREMSPATLGAIIRSSQRVLIGAEATAERQLTLDQ